MTDEELTAIEAGFRYRHWNVLTCRRTFDVCRHTACMAGRDLIVEVRRLRTENDALRDDRDTCADKLRAANTALCVLAQASEEPTT